MSAPIREPLSRHRFTWRTCASAAVPATAHEGPLGALAEAARREGTQRDGLIFREMRTRLQLELQEVADGWGVSAVEVGALEQGLRRFPETDDLNAAIQQLWLWRMESRWPAPPQKEEYVSGWDDAPVRRGTFVDAVEGDPFPPGVVVHRLRGPGK